MSEKAVSSRAAWFCCQATQVARPLGQALCPHMVDARSRIGEAVPRTARIVLAALALGGAGCASVAPSHYALSDMQGAWWSDCNEPAAEFLVDHDQYSGDFAGRHQLMLEGDVVTFASGLPSSHDVHLSGEPMAFRIVVATGSTLVLAPVNDRGSNPWRLESCERPTSR